jgi:hypothetical protein
MFRKLISGALNEINIVVNTIPSHMYNLQTNLITQYPSVHSHDTVWTALSIPVRPPPLILHRQRLNKMTPFWMNI